MVVDLEGDDGMYGDDEGDGEGEKAWPASIAPRVHVLCYRRLGASFPLVRTPPPPAVPSVSEHQQQGRGCQAADTKVMVGTGATAMPASPGIPRAGAFAEQQQQEQQGGGNYNPSGGNNNPQQQGWGSKRAVQKSYSTSKLPPLGGGGGMKGANPTHSSSSNKRMGGTRTLPLPPADDVLLKQSKSATELRGGGGGGAGGVIAELQALKGSRVQAELDLEDTIKAGFETIIDRKGKTVQANVSRTEPGKDKPGSHWDLSGAAGGITGLGLQHYSDNDRLAAITQFVARPDIFAKVTAILSADLEL